VSHGARVEESCTKQSFFFLLTSALHAVEVHVPYHTKYRVSTILKIGARVEESCTKQSFFFLLTSALHAVEVHVPYHTKYRVSTILKIVSTNAELKTGTLEHLITTL
jgi:hypothetical protein